MTLHGNVAGLPFETSSDDTSACGVGFVATRDGTASRAVLDQALRALGAMEHRGAVLADGVTGDGAGVMADIPFDLFGYRPGEVAVASFMLATPPARRDRALRVLEETFSFMGMDLFEYRAIPTDPGVLGPLALERMPELLHAFIRWPPTCRTEASFETLLYLARQKARTRLRLAGIVNEVFFVSMSPRTIVYKALTRSDDLPRFYPDLLDPSFRTRFAIVHRRFSTNTETTWDKVQPFRLVAHNGEINTIRSNRSWSYSREQALGLPPDELLTHDGISDTGTFNEMVEALRYRSSMPRIEDVLALMIPPAGEDGPYYRFWSRALEPWDGPAAIAYADGQVVGARMDRNGFRPIRWCTTAAAFYLASEAGAFQVPGEEVTARGTLRAGSGVQVDLKTGAVLFRDPSRSPENEDAVLDPHLFPLEPADPGPPRVLSKRKVWTLHKEELEDILLPMIAAGKEPIGSMGDTASLAVLSDEPRSFFDYFFQTFAQVTNPPLDYLRERRVTDLTTFLGKRPNVFAAKELVPPAPGLLLASPILSLGQLAAIRDFPGGAPHPHLTSRVIDITFPRESGVEGFRHATERIAEDALAAVRDETRILVLSDEAATHDRPPVPSLLALRAVVRELNRWGLRLEASVVVAAGDARTPHQVAALLGFGATAVSPVLALEIARHEGPERFPGTTADERERRLLDAYEQGLLKVMSKMGISVARSYTSAKLFTAVGLGADVVRRFFDEVDGRIGGLTLRRLAEKVLHDTRETEGELPDLHLLREKTRGGGGERHAMTSARTRVVHDLVEYEPGDPEGAEVYARYLEAGRAPGPVHLRHLLRLREVERPLPLDAVEPRPDITRRFGAGAMSFGAISAESQRDIIRAMRILGGRSGSGEGGENPYYFVDGTTATTKQVASARFGVTAEYLAAGEEIEIKIAQGAKPGEGGQLMSAKVGPEIARARHSVEGVDLISPPPLHDLYSIEDLKGLVHELKTVCPGKPVVVKLVSGAQIGTIAVGVVKAGADVIHVSGGDGGTGAATITSMKHAGLPWELGLAEVHQTLTARGLRDRVTVRVDGGLHTGADVAVAAALGADEFGFGKLLLVAEGCILARICEKNTCPRGIATHDEKFKRKYRGRVEHVVRMLSWIAEDLRGHLARAGLRTLAELVGRADLLQLAPEHARLVTARGLDLSSLLATAAPAAPRTRSEAPPPRPPTPLEEALDRAASPALDRGEPVVARFDIRTSDRAVPARLAGRVASRTHRLRREAQDRGLGPSFAPPPLDLRFEFRGSAGQGFGAFLEPGFDVHLIGEANDGVGKSMSGGRIAISQPPGPPCPHGQDALVGNGALYGATGGELFVGGGAGDRFAVRASGVTAVVESVGMHACGYMTGGLVAILGAASHNIGSGMTGGLLLARADVAPFVHAEYLAALPLDGPGLDLLRDLLERHRLHTGSPLAAALLADLPAVAGAFRKYVPKGLLARNGLAKAA